MRNWIKWIRDGLNQTKKNKDNIQDLFDLMWDIRKDFEIVARLTVKNKKFQLISTDFIYDQERENTRKKGYKFDGYLELNKKELWIKEGK